MQFREEDTLCRRERGSQRASKWGREDGSSCRIIHQEKVMFLSVCIHVTERDEMGGDLQKGKMEGKEKRRGSLSPSQGREKGDYIGPVFFLLLSLLCVWCEGYDTTGTYIIHTRYRHGANRGTGLEMFLCRGLVGTSTIDLKCLLIGMVGWSVSVMGVWFVSRVVD